MAKAKTAVVVNKSPTAAVAVNSDRSISLTILEIIIFIIDGRCIEKYFYMKIWIFAIPKVTWKKKVSHLWDRVMGNYIFKPIPIKMQPPIPSGFSIYHPHYR